MPYCIEYFHPKVLAEIESWPVDILADYTRIAELLMEHGSNLRGFRTRARLERVCMNSGREASRESGERCIAFS